VAREPRRISSSTSSSFEIGIQMINQNSQKYSLKRNLKRQLPLESKFHRGSCKLEHGYFASSRTCRLEKVQQPDSALRILTYQLKDQKAQETHLNNLKISLNCRIKAARLQQNNALVTTLNKELQEIARR